MKLLTFLTLALMFMPTSLVVAQAPHQNEAVAPEHFAAPMRHQPFPRTNKIVERFIAEKIASGAIDPTEYEQLKTQRQTLRQEIKALREAGDEDAAQAKIQALREQRQQKRQYVKALIDDNPELRQRIVDRRQHLRMRQIKRRQHMLDRRMERLRDRRSDRTIQ